MAVPRRFVLASDTQAREQHDLSNVTHGGRIHLSVHRVIKKAPRRLGRPRGHEDPGEAGRPLCSSSAVTLWRCTAQPEHERRGRHRLSAPVRGGLPIASFAGAAQVRVPGRDEHAAPHRRHRAANDGPRRPAVDRGRHPGAAVPRRGRGISVAVEEIEPRGSAARWRRTCSGSRSARIRRRCSAFRRGRPRGRADPVGSGAQRDRRAWQHHPPGELLGRFARDGEREVVGVLTDLVGSGLVHVTGRGRAPSTGRPRTPRGVRSSRAGDEDSTAAVAWAPRGRRSRRRARRPWSCGPCPRPRW